MAEYSKKAQSYIGKKISKLKDEGMPRDQQIAVSISMAREKGLKVPKKPKD